MGVEALPAFVSRRAALPTGQIEDFAAARRAKATRAARYAIRQISRGQLGVNLVQGFQLQTGITVDATPHGFQLDYLGYRTAPCRTPAGAIMVWAHMVNPEGTT